MKISKMKIQNMLQVINLTIQRESSKSDLFNNNNNINSL